MKTLTLLALACAIATPVKAFDASQGLPLPNPLISTYADDYDQSYFSGYLLWPDSPAAQAYYSGAMNGCATMYYDAIANGDCVNDALLYEQSALMYAQLFSGIDEARLYFTGEAQAFNLAYIQALNTL